MAGLKLSTYKKSSVVLEPKEENLVSSFVATFNKDIRWGATGLNDHFKEAFYLELSILISAGVDIKASLELIEKQQSKQRFKTILRDVQEKIVAGMSLSEAVKNTGYFTPYEYFSLQIGEETGKIARILSELASFYAKKLKQRRQIIQALSYPCIVIFTSMGAILFMMNFIVPMFSDVFKRFGGELPYITKLIIGISGWFRGNLWIILLCCFGSIVAFRACRNQEWFKKYSSQILVRTPVIGSMITHIYLARLCNSLALLIASKVPLLQSINLVEQMVDFYPIYTSLAQIELEIMNGKSLHQSLAKFSIYDQRLITLIKVGEEVNRLDFFFEKLSNQYSEEIEHKASLLSSALEPFIIIFLGIVVGVILVAMYLPLFELSTNVG